jgi:hypothetical protein
MIRLENGDVGVERSSNRELNLEKGAGMRDSNHTAFNGAEIVETKPKCGHM